MIAVYLKTDMAASAAHWKRARYSRWRKASAASKAWSATL
jgi:hypothetical protein